MVGSFLKQGIESDELWDSSQPELFNGFQDTVAIDVDCLHLANCKVFILLNAKFYCTRIVSTSLIIHLILRISLIKEFPKMQS